jgi:uncharacterized protein (TIGR00290 family)
MEKVLVCWSGGKDSALALHEVLQRQGYEVVSLLTTITEDYDRISMHGVRSELVERQAEALGLPLEKVLVSRQSPNEVYEKRMGEALLPYKEGGVQLVVFGDIFLEDVRRYREENLAKIGMKGLFPLWGRDTGALALEFIELGFQAVLTCVDTEALDGAFAGRLFDRQLLADLPSGADPCGENGEFHSFVYDGPLFSRRIFHTKGEVILRDERFCYCDLVPASRL